eukprot:TRINITY_DN3538_c0_g1_i1.p1 TRINITY_DN3538_c0_g1~~TRINITY_DN3538_c0_g1_i1.p1  ORF type:complete len:1064 (+),score=289.89 TRINITY_DN3538_c0_g1_i1:121-3312(+)
MEDQENRLSEFQLAEIKKAFAICDQDGNGSVDASELRVVIRALLDEDPTDEEMQQIMVTMDKDQNGRVELQEFIDAMADWFSEDERSRGAKRRKLNADQERQEVHTQIRSFFQQFKKGDNFDVIRKKISRGGSKTGGTAQDGTLMDVDRNDPMAIFGPENKMDSTAKLEFLKWYRTAMTNIARVIQVINGDHRFEQLDAVSHLAKMLSIVEVFGTPSERRAVADDIVALFEQLVRANMVKRLIQLMSDNSQHSLQYHSLRCLFYFAPGPRIASTPRESLLHPDQWFFKRLIFSEGAMPMLFTMILHPNNEVREQAVLVLGTMAAHNWEARDELLRLRAMPALLQLVNTNTPLSVVRKVSWAISVLCGVTHPTSKLPPLELVSPAVPHLGALIHFEDEAVLVHVLNALALILPGMDVDPNARNRLLSLLVTKPARVILADLQLLKALAEYDQTQTELFVQAGLLDALTKLIRHVDIEVRLSCCDLLHLLAKKILFIEAMIKTGLVEMLITFVNHDDNLRWKLVKVIKYIARGTPHQVLQLVNNKAIQSLCSALSHFKAFDRVLTEVYKFCGATYNFEFVNDILTTLEKILDAGELAAEDTVNGGNKFALEFDLECIDQIRKFMTEIKEARPEDLNAWRQRKPGEGNSVEAKVRNILYKVKIAHDSPATTKPAKAHISRMIGELWMRHFAEQPAQQQQQIVDPASVVIAAPVPAAASIFSIKCYFDDDIRVLEVPRTASWDEIRIAIFAKYGLTIDRHINITYADEEGDHITVDSLALLEKASLVTPGRAIKLYLVEKHGHSSSLGSPIGSPKAPMSPLAHRLASANDDDVGGRKRTRDGEVKKSGESEKHVINTTIVVPPASAFFQAKPGEAASSLVGDLNNIRRQAQKQAFEDLEMRTHFGKAELEQLYSDWVKNASADGQVNRQQFETGMIALGITDPLIIEQNFSAFDQNRDGLIDFREFVCGLSTVLRGDTEERLRFMFKSYDLADRGYLTREEIYKIFHASLVTADGKHASDAEIRRQVESTFAEIDADGDGKLSYEEFKHAVETQKLLINCSVHFAKQ